jgi:hypothetical protein
MWAAIRNSTDEMGPCCRPCRIYNHFGEDMPPFNTRAPGVGSICGIVVPARQGGPQGTLVSESDIPAALVPNSKVRLTIAVEYLAWTALGGLAVVSYVSVPYLLGRSG